MITLLQYHCQRFPNLVSSDKIVAFQLINVSALRRMILSISEKTMTSGKKQLLRAKNPILSTLQLLEHQQSS